MFRKLTDESLLRINNELTKNSYSNVFGTEDVNDKLASLYDIIGKSVDVHAPVCEKIVSSNQNVLIHKDNPFREKRNFYKKLLKLYGPNPYHNEQYKFYRNKALNFDRLLFRQNVSRVINSASATSQVSKKFLFLNVLKNQSFQNFSHLNIDGQISNNPVDIANHLNNYFTSIKSQYFPHQAHNFEVPTYLLNYVNEKVPTEQFFDIPLMSVGEVTHYMKNIKTDCSRGLDEIPSKVLKFSASCLAPAVTDVINQSITDSLFPEQWKIARVTAIPKPAFKSDPLPKNLRPISVLNTLSKILEKHVSHHLYEFLNSHGLIFSLQSGSRPLHSCETSLLQLTDAVSEACTKNKKVGILYNDFSKAFDLLDHDIFLKKLEAYKLSTNALKWFCSYFTSRSQCVQFNNVLSEVESIVAGVPQGSTLGPLAFLIYVNDMPQVIDPKIGFLTSLVDDSNFITFAPNCNQLINNITVGSGKIQEWCGSNSQVLNLTKLAIMEFFKSQPQNYTPIQVVINDIQIASCSHKKLLGVYLDSTLTFSEHLKHIRQISLMQISTLRKILSYTTVSLRLCYYNAFILPHLTYCSSVWALRSKSQMDTLFLLQKRAVRLVFNAPFASHTLELFRRSAILPIMFAIKIKKLCLVYKCLYEMAPNYLSVKFKFAATYNKMWFDKNFIRAITS